MSLHEFAETHEVFNQVPPLDGANLYRVDLPLQEWVRRYQGGWAEQRLDIYGALAGGPLMAAGFLPKVGEVAQRHGFHHQSRPPRRSRMRASRSTISASSSATGRGGV